MKETTVLVVEDEAIVAHDLQQTLEYLGYEVLTIVASGEEAIQEAAQLQPDLALMDIVLQTDMDGIETAAQIRQRFDIPVIFVTAFADDEVLERAKITEPFGYIVKPFDEKELHVNIQMALYKHEMEKKLKESEESFRTLAENANDGILIGMDKEGAHAFANQRAAEIMGYSVAELLETSIKDLVHPEHVDKMQQRYRQRLEGKTLPKQYETLIVRKDGQSVPIELTASKTVWQGQPANIVIFRDITQRVQAEQERDSLIAELGAKNTELENFTRTVSHDLKSPLVTIQGFLNLLMQNVADGNTEQAESSAAYIFEAVEKMRQLLDELLKLSRIGHVVNPPEQVSMDDLAREAVDTLMGQIEERGARVAIGPTLQDNKALVYGDRVRLREVWENLLGNAVKYMGAQPDPRVELGLRRDGDETVFYVRDNGIGIDPRFHDKIFGLFDKLDPTTEGVGVGLAIVKRIIEVHGGRVWAESEGEGQGSVFCFTMNIEGKA